MPVFQEFSVKKSAGFSPLSLSYGNESMIREHMISHYNRVNSATTKLDTSEPKSRIYLKSHKLRPPKKQKQSWRVQTSRPHSQLSSRYPPGTDLYRSSEHHGRESYEIQKSPKSDVCEPQRSARGEFAKGTYTSDALGEGYCASSAGKHRENYVRRHFDIPTLEISRAKSLGHLSTQTGPLTRGMLSDRSVSRNSRSSPVVEENYSMYPEFQLIQKKRKELEEDEKYLDFLNGMTREVLQRGIFSNRVLMHVCLGHIEKHKSVLNQNRMWEIVEKLKEDLNVKDGED